MSQLAISHFLEQSNVTWHYRSRCYCYFLFNFLHFVFFQDIQVFATNQVFIADMRVSQWKDWVFLVTDIANTVSILDCISCFPYLATKVVSN